MRHEEEHQEVVESGNPFRAQQLPVSAAQAEGEAKAFAEVQAALVIAKKFPRNHVQCVDRILMACARPGLADAAVYEYSRGGQVITGPSIRLAEEFARSWGNLKVGVTELTRSGNSSECVAYAWDLETNTYDERRFIVKHWRDTRQGGKLLTDERDIYETIANQGARRKRACILAMIPTDVQEAAVAECERTLKTTADTSPANVLKIVETFGKLGVTKEQIETLIQRRMDAITPAQVVRLKRIYGSLRDGMASPGDFFRPPAGQEAADDPPATGNEALKRSLRKKPEPAPAPVQEEAEAEDSPQLSEEALSGLMREATTREALDEVLASAAHLPEDKQIAMRKLRDFYAQKLPAVQGRSQVS